MKLRMLAIAIALVVAFAPPAFANPALAHQDVIDFVNAAGWKVCESVANDPPANMPGARAKHLIEVGNPCARDGKAKPTVLFVLEFDTRANRDLAVGQFIATYEKAIIEMGDAWPIGDRFAVFASGPAHDAVKASLDAEVAKRQAAR